MADYSDIGLDPFLEKTIPGNNNISVDDAFSFQGGADRNLITPGFIPDASIGSAKIGRAAIGNANIGTAAIGTANIGTLSFNEIHGGTAILGGTNNGNGVLNILDDQGTTRLIANTGSFTILNIDDGLPDVLYNFRSGTSGVSFMARSLDVGQPNIAGTNNFVGGILLWNEGLTGAKITAQDAQLPGLTIGSVNTSVGTTVVGAILTLTGTSTVVASSGTASCMLYLDTSAGKLRLMALFPTGTAVLVASEP